MLTGTEGREQSKTERDTRDAGTRGAYREPYTAETTETRAGCTMDSDLRPQRLTDL